MPRYVGDSETSVDCKICGDGKNEDAEAVIRNQAAQSPISHDRGCHEGVHQHSLEQSSDDVSMHRRRLRGQCGRCSMKASAAIALRGSKTACTMRNSWVSWPTAAFPLRARNVWRGERGVMKRVGLMLVLHLWIRCEQRDGPPAIRYMYKNAIIFLFLGGQSSEVGEWAEPVCSEVIVWLDLCF